MLDHCNWGFYAIFKIIYHEGQEEKQKRVIIRFCCLSFFRALSIKKFDLLGCFSYC